jgi:flagellar basal body-associated protein FliL
MEGPWLLIAVVVVVLAVVLVIAMAMPLSRQKHAQAVLDIIPRTVRAWRGLGEAEAPGPEVLESGSTPALEEEQAPSANSDT